MKTKLLMLILLTGNLTACATNPNPELVQVNNVTHRGQMFTDMVYVETSLTAQPTPHLIKLNKETIEIK